MKSLNSLCLKLVGAPGFEPGTSCSQSKRASRTALRPDIGLGVEQTAPGTSGDFVRSALRLDTSIGL